jgi:CHAT domain-containing protein/tetratricopeptide (TPR) repeat protein
MMIGNLRAAAPWVTPLVTVLCGIVGAASIQAQSSVQSQPATRPAGAQVLTGKDKQRVAELEQRAMELRMQGSYAEALPLAQEATAIRMRVQGAEHWETVEDACAVKTLERILALPAAAQADMQAVTRLDAESLRLYQQGRDVEAIPVMRQALEIRQRHLGRDDLDVATTTMNLGFLLRESGRLEEAEQHFSEALATYRRLLGDEHPTVAECLANVAALFQLKGDYGEARRLYRTALAIARSAFSDEDPLVGLIRSNLATVLYDLGDYAAAEALYHHALAIFRKSPDDPHADVAATLNNLALLAQDRGQYAAAEALHRQALKVKRALPDENRPRIAVSLCNLAQVLTDQGRLAEAEQLHRQALAIRRDVFGQRHPLVANSLNSLALTLAARGDHAGAVALCRQAKEIWRESLGAEHPEVAASLANLGRFRQARGEYGLAEENYRAALRIRREALGETHPRVVATLNSLASLHYARGEYEQAEATWTLAAESFEAARQRVSPRGLDRSEFAALRSPLGFLAACLARRDAPRRAWERLEANLARGVLDGVSARFTRPLNPDERDREQRLVGWLDWLDERVAVLSQAERLPEHGDEPLRTLLQERDALQAELAEFERALAKRYGPAAGKVYDLARIQRWLRPDAALLAWLDIEGDPQAADPSGEHWACVVRSEGNPAWIKLPGTGESGRWTEDDDNLAARARELLNRPPAKPKMRARVLDRLHAQRIAPIRPHLSGVRHLVILPAGWMAGVPVEALTDEYTTSYAPSGTMFAWLRKRSEQASEPEDTERVAGLLALGDPSFGRSDFPGDLTTTRSAEGPDPQARRIAPDLDSVLQRTRGSSFVPLPGTRNEVEAIARLFRRAAGDREPRILLGSDASEQRLDALAKSGELRRFRFLHVATHGVMDDRIAMRSALILAQDRLPDSLERVVAGEEVYDGRLTAGQIVRTWKLDADLVTLSGCRTALGKAAGGEGYLGFSQALFVAGARSLLLSLWKVDDTATALLMTRFYENLLGAFDQPRKLPGQVYGPGEALPKAEALREAKAWLRGLKADEVRTFCEAYRLPLPSTLERGQAGRITPAEVPDYPLEHPYYWSAFILIGDPR